MKEQSKTPFSSRCQLKSNYGSKAAPFLSYSQAPCLKYCTALPPRTAFQETCSVPDVWDYTPQHPVPAAEKDSTSHPVLPFLGLQVHNLSKVPLPPQWALPKHLSPPSRRQELAPNPSSLQNHQGFAPQRVGGGRPDH